MFPDAAVTYLSPDLLNLKKKRLSWDFSGGPVVRILPANARDSGSIPSLESFHMPMHNLASVLYIQPSCLDPQLGNKRVTSACCS